MTLLILAMIVSALVQRSLGSILQWLSDTPLGTSLCENGILFPGIESLHMLAITLVVGSIAAIDLRLLGWASRNRTVSTLTREVLPLTWVAFGVAATTGMLLFISHAVNYAHNNFFQAKMALLICAFVNMLIFHFVTWRSITQWDTSAPAPIAVRQPGGFLCAFGSSSSSAVAGSGSLWSAFSRWE